MKRVTSAWYSQLAHSGGIHVLRTLKQPVESLRFLICSFHHPGSLNDQTVDWEYVSSQ